MYERNARKTIRKRRLGLARPAESGPPGTLGAVPAGPGLSGFVILIDIRRKKLNGFLARGRFFFYPSIESLFRKSFERPARWPLK
jgi:hypothetical protein